MKKFRIYDVKEGIFSLFGETVLRHVLLDSSCGDNTAPAHVQYCSNGLVGIRCGSKVYKNKFSRQFWPTLGLPVFG